MQLASASQLILMRAVGLLQCLHRKEHMDLQSGKGFVVGESLANVKVKLTIYSFNLSYHGEFIAVDT